MSDVKLLFFILDAWLMLVDIVSFVLSGHLDGWELITKADSTGWDM